jgi:hypothetical protein
LDLVWRVPIRWIALMILLAIVTSVDIARPRAGELSVSVDAGALALASVALIWLPALLKVLLLTGGSVKAGGVEASAPGMFSREDILDFLTRAKAVTTLREDQVAGNVALVELDAAVDRLAYDTLDGSRSLDADALRRLALEYERLRRDSPPGPQRTSAMTRIVNESRVRAASSIELAERRSQHLLRSPSQGERIVGLALAQEAPRTKFSRTSSI